MRRPRHWYRDRTRSESRRAGCKNRPASLRLSTSYVGARPIFQPERPNNPGRQHMSDLTRRGFLAGTTGAAAAGVLTGTAAAGQPPAGSAAPLRYRLGIVTYNIAASWDIPTILRVCRAVGLAAVELRTTHRHGV